MRLHNRPPFVLFERWIGAIRFKQSDCTKFPETKTTHWGGSLCYLALSQIYQRKNLEICVREVGGFYGM